MLDTTEDLEPRNAYHWINCGTFTVIENNATFDHETGEATGEIKVERDGETEWIDAELLESDVDSHIYEIPTEIVEDPEEVLIQFAQSQINDVVHTLGYGHDYNGIDNVDRVVDLLAASDLATDQI